MITFTEAVIRAEQLTSPNAHLTSIPEIKETIRYVLRTGGRRPSWLNVHLVALWGIWLDHQHKTAGLHIGGAKSWTRTPYR